MIEYKGEKYTQTRLAEHFGITRQCLASRIKIYGTDGAIMLCEMPDEEYGQFMLEIRRQAQAKTQNRLKATYEYHGGRYTIKDIATKVGVDYKTLFSWITRYGYHVAIKLCDTPADERRLRIRELSKKPKRDRRVRNILSPELPANDPDYELKNRINSWRQLGWSDDEIKIKARMV